MLYFPSLFFPSCNSEFYIFFFFLFDFIPIEVRNNEFERLIRKINFSSLAGCRKLMRSSVSSKFQKLTNYARACNGQVIDEVLWHRGARIDAGEGGEKKEKRLQRKTAIVPLPSATREKGRRPILSRRKNGTGYDEHRCRGFSTDSPMYKIFLFKKYISQYSGIRFISLFLVRLKNNIYLFSKYFRKIFNIFETLISIDLC